MRDAYDYIIVGAGSAGCVLASKLSENPRNCVLLVESGPPNSHPLIAMPRGIGKLQTPGNPHYLWYDVSKGGNRPDEKWRKGHTIGGSSSINGMVYTRGTPDDYDNWERLGCPGWGWAYVGPCFVELEDHELGPSLWRGVGGPLHVSMPPKASPLSHAVIAAAASAGTPTVEDFNDLRATRDGGFGLQPRTIRSGRRFSAADAFLVPARKRSNLDVVTRTQALSVEFDGLRASGLRLASPKGERVVAVRREVILSAGAIESPKLLQLSGIGPAALLNRLGIKVRVDSPNVGRNLREHRTINIVYKLTGGGHNFWLRAPGVFLSALQYFALRSGPLTDASFDVGGFVKTMPGLDRPDGQIGVGLYSFDPKDVSNHPGMTIYGYFLRPQSQGELAIRSPDPKAPPLIDANYMSAEADRVHTVSLMRHIRKIASQPALAPYISAEIRPGAAVISDGDLLEASFEYGTTGYHVAGTCRMGSDDGAVLDPQLRVRGVSGLRVIDTSIMPELISGNTNAPAMVIAWRAAQLIAQTNRAAL